MSDTTTEPIPATPAHLLYEGEWKYPGYHNNTSICHLRLFVPVEKVKPLIAIFTELDSNPGTSVTNRIEHLATMVWQWQERPQRGLTVIEHYPNRGVYNSFRDRWQYPEEFDLLAFEEFDGKTFGLPKWRRIARQEVEAQIGQTFG